MKIKTLLLAAAFAGLGTLTAMAQSSPGSSSPSSSPSSPSAQQPSASPSSPSGSSTMGAGSSQNVTAATHCKTAQGQVQVKGTVGSGSSAGIPNVSESVKATLPNC